jgi:YbaB/EbfC DNA-binding family protein
MAPDADDLAAAMDTYHRRRAGLSRLPEAMAGVRATAMAPRQVVSATVGARGEVVEIKFPSNAYRNLPPTELSAVIVRTIEQARQKALQAAAEVLDPLLPPALSARDLLSGTADLERLLHTETRPMDWLGDKEGARS